MSRKSSSSSSETSETRPRLINHNHEFVSSTNYERDTDGERHNHDINGVTSGPILTDNGRNHIHKIDVLTDTFDDHFHKVCRYTSKAIYIPGGKHFHVVRGQTTRNDNHDHDYYFITAIQDPSNVPKNIR